jgi:hypothetical protein
VTAQHGRHITLNEPLLASPRRRLRWPPQSTPAQRSTSS